MSRFSKLLISLFGLMTMRHLVRLDFSRFNFVILDVRFKPYNVKYEQYYIEASASLLKYEFYSEGPRGSVRKQVVFKAFKENPNVFNLGFGDVDEKGEINDTAITNNHDSQKVLATVALTIFKFYEKHPDCYVYVTGSTKTRTRLYRMGITNNLAEIRNDFDVYGFIEESWETFMEHRDYEAFLVKRRKK